MAVSGAGAFQGASSGASPVAHPKEVAAAHQGAGAACRVPFAPALPCMLRRSKETPRPTTLRALTGSNAVSRFDAFKFNPTSCSFQ